MANNYKDSYDDDQSEPSWLDIGNDKTHRQEVQPLLFGDGSLTLKDPTICDEDDDHDDDTSTIVTNKSKMKSYGTAGGKNTTDNNNNNRGTFWTIPTSFASSNKINSKEKGGDENDNNNNNSDDDSPPPQEDFDDYSTVITYNNISGRPDMPLRPWPVKVFFVIEIYALLTCLVLLVSQLIPIIFVPFSDFDLGYLLLKVYICLFSLIFMIVEVDQPFFSFIERAAFLQTFATRGFLYTFFGLICFEEAYSEKAHMILSGGRTWFFDVSWYAVANRVAAFSMIVLGILYFLMGIFCLQKIRDKYVYGDRAIWKAYKHAMDAYTNRNNS